MSPRIWIGNRIRVAPHYDVKENVAVCVAGRRRFTLFPPGQIANLYPGPLEQTPAGTPVSMVDQHAPDLERYPRYAEAWTTAQQATLEPGDAIYIPYCWWHGVESLEPVSILVNYWWNEGMTRRRGQPLRRAAPRHAGAQAPARPTSARCGAECSTTTCSRPRATPPLTCPKVRRVCSAARPRPVRENARDPPGGVGLRVKMICIFSASF